MPSVSACRLVAPAIRKGAVAAIVICAAWICRAWSVAARLTNGVGVDAAVGAGSAEVAVGVGAGVADIGRVGTLIAPAVWVARGVMDGKAVGAGVAVGVEGGTAALSRALTVACEFCQVARPGHRVVALLGHHGARLLRPWPFGLLPWLAPPRA